jgi:hypothetical protein
MAMPGDASRWNFVLSIGADRGRTAKGFRNIPSVHLHLLVALIPPWAISDASSPLDDVFEIQSKGRGAETARLRKFARVATAI